MRNPPQSLKYQYRVLLMKKQLKWSGNDLKKWRKEMGLTQVAAAAALDITREAYGKLERGINNIDHRTVLACLYLKEHKEQNISTRP